MQPFTPITSRVVALPIDNIDTDQIIPARFLKTISKEGLGQHLFADWRYNPDGSPKPDFPLNQPWAREAHILLVGDNFGCGSSREHAPWALIDFGFRAVISTSFADIFRNNALKNGLLPVVVDTDTHRRLFDLVGANPSITLTLDLASQSLILPDGQQVHFPIDAFNKRCLLEGIDQLGYLLKQEPLIQAYEAAHPARVNTRITEV
ncbi:MAG: 3-isopropylmalate dehydratase small subunit [Anaerolineae bacterium]|nr:3-isopropylmalate dehydratase small subunit [Anaerolineae bacterium]MDW8070107.1 3-isopropylmalate dehydratase small subunit [Anaerolineae bacterium]